MPLVLRGDTTTTAFQGYWPSTAPVQPRTRVWGSDQPLEVASGSATTSSPRTHWTSTCTYGELAPVRPIVTNLRLPGQYDERLLGSLGLQGPYYNWNRWYLPGVGRYLEPDPIALRGRFNTPFGVDWYGYAGQNPLRWTDRTGLTWWDKWFGSYPKDFKNWMHRNWKNVEDWTKEEIEEGWEEWNRLGRPPPDNKGPWDPDPIPPEVDPWDFEMMPLIYLDVCGPAGEKCMPEWLKPKREQCLNG